MSLNRSCTYHRRDECDSQIAEIMMRIDDMPERFPEAFMRVASYPMGFKPSWGCCDELRILHMYEVPPISEKEPLALNDSRVWC